MTNEPSPLNETLLTPRDPIEIPSPFLPGTKVQYAWDSTSLGYLKTCPRLYQYNMLEGWATKSESIHLKFGGEYHQALQDYEIERSTGISHEDAIHDVVRALLERTEGWVVDTETKPGKYKNRQSLIGLVIDYLDNFAEDPATTYILADGRPAVELSFRFELDFGPTAAQNEPTIIHPSDQDNFAEPITTPQPYIICGHLDRVVEFNNQLLVMDHKTTITTPSEYYFHQYEPNNQMTLYTLAGQIVLGTQIKGVCITAAQIKLVEPNAFVRGFTFRTPDQLTEWLDDLRFHLHVAETYAASNYWPMNDTSCDKFGGCKFRGICSKSPDVREIFLKSDFTQIPLEERWNPLRSR